MYKRNAQGWSKHLDFMLIDIFSLQLAFVLAVLYRQRVWAYSTALYRNLGFLLILVDALVLVLNNTMHSVVSRGYFVEAEKTFKHCLWVFASAAIFMFATQSGSVYSRIILFLTFLLHLLLGYVMRILWKTVLKHNQTGKDRHRRMLLVSTPDTAEHLLQRLTGDKMADFEIIGVVLTEHTDKKNICGCPVVTRLEDAADYIAREWVDSVYVNAPLTDERIVTLMDDCALMAVPTHYYVTNINKNNNLHFSERIGGTTVITSSVNYVTPVQLLFKRCVDISAGLAGSLIALLLIAVIGPVIKKQSPGPVLFKQERIGKNGRHFIMYKLRSMHMDAEARKKDLASANRVHDGMMFKLDFDPRIIGNVTLPDGTKKTGIGDFIRRTSLDEFPQFFNVLKGDMSFVGTRPPTLDEWEKYSLHHRARLSAKPGITGLWQVRGRSKITDFDEIVALDTRYISEWSPALDIKIILKTFAVVFKKEGAL